MNKKLSIDEVDLAGKRVFCRVDFNVPLKEGVVTDDSRIQAAIPTIRYAVDAGAMVIVASHLGRPKGKPDPAYSLTQIVSTFEAALGSPVKFVDDCVGEKGQKAMADLKPGEVLLLENIRFCPEETANDPEFAKKLANNIDVYVNDAFGAAHRAHASTEGITHHVPVAASGFLLRDEIDYFNRSMANPDRPLAVIIGGAKVASKLDALKHLVDRCDIMVVGGGMAFTFLKSMGINIGKSILEEDMLDNCRAIMTRAGERGVKFYLPVDVLVAESIDAAEAADLVTIQEIPDNMYCPDIGPASIALFRLALKSAKTIVWNGPMGVFENPAFAAGTVAIAHTIADGGALTVVGGGDSVSAVSVAGVGNKIGHLSTGGGAFLELLEGKDLPGIAALTDAAGVSS
jgi:phosphoglycerate kinase